MKPVFGTIIINSVSVIYIYFFMTIKQISPPVYITVRLIFIQLY